MYFLWKETELGSVRISSDGLMAFLDFFLLPPVEQRMALIGEGDVAVVTLLLSAGNSTPKEMIAKRLSSVLSPMGITLKVVWDNRGTCHPTYFELRTALLQNPWIWMLIVAAAALIFNAGWRVFFWTSFWGTAAWFTVKGALYFLQKIKAAIFRERIGGHFG